jgi:hypothetical protein
MNLNRLPHTFRELWETDDEAGRIETLRGLYSPEMDYLAKRSWDELLENVRHTIDVSYNNFKQGKYK